MTTTSHDAAFRRLRVLSYNIHSCRGTDGRVDPARIAETIARCRPDIVALQEVDVGRKRSGGADQAQMVAAHLKLASYFHPALHLESEQYGDAILTALPTKVIHAGPLPSVGEPRGAIWVAVDLGGVTLQVFNTHLGLRRRERIRQVSTLLGPEWLGSPECRDRPTLVMGDFNAVPSSVPYRMLARHGRDALVETGARIRPTFHSRFPVFRLDHIFVSGGVRAVEAQVVADPKTRVSSDHLPVLATIDVPVAAHAQAAGHSRPVPAEPVR